MCKRLFLATIIALLSALGSSANAQVTPSDSPGASPKDKALEDKYRSDEIERVRREAERREERRTTRFPQIKQDFERIQIISGDLLQASSSNVQLDYARISEAAGEIRRRATRLKSNLFPSASEDTKQIKQQGEESRDLKSLLIALDKSIASFAHNPIFGNIKIVNSQDSTKAERELEKIIKLSATTIKKAELKRR
jgi:hypothetical protein